MKHTQILFIAIALFAIPAIAGPTKAPSSTDWNNPASVVQTAIDGNPSLAALATEARAAQERVAPAGSLPNPMLMGGVQNLPIDLSYDFMTMYMVGASQTLVRKSRRDSLRKSAELEVERLRRQYDARKAEVERDARTAWIDAAAAENQITATREILRVLQSVTDASRIQYEAGAVPQTDLIRATLEQSNVDHQIFVLRRQRNAALARLLPLLQLPQGTPVPEFSLPQAMERPHGAGIDATLPDSTPALAELQSEVARAEEDLNLAKLATRPDINLEATYGVRPRDVDMFAVVARIELPVRRSTLIAPRIREAILRRDAGLQQIEAMRLQLRQDLGTALVLRNEAIEQINFHLDHFVPIAKLGFESALVSYQNGKTTLDSVLGTLRTYISLNVDYYDYLRQQMAAEADIDAIRHGARSGSAGASAMTAAPATSMPASASGTKMK